MRRLSRRQVLTGAALATAAGAANNFGRNLSALASVTVGGTPNGGDTLVVLFLRGGADGLNIVVPYGDDDYHRLRPTLRLADPKDRAADKKAHALDLNGFFGLHPVLAPLIPLYQKGHLAVVHAVGSGDQTRSHFEAMATMERGLARDTGTASGWLARHLMTTANEVESPLRAVAFADTMPDSLRGATSATALTSLTDFRLVAPQVVPTGNGGQVHHAVPAPRNAALTATLNDLYGGATSPPNAVLNAGKETLSALDAIQRLSPANYRPAPGAVYPDDPIGVGFRQTACLLKGNVGLEVACLNMGGWDTHVAQGRDSGWQPNLLGYLGRALAAFYADLGPHQARTTVLVMTEFGRRAYENTGLGTDHGRASFMFLLGGGVQGGKVVVDWPGLSDRALDGPGDLRVTTDYRDVLAEILQRRLKNPHLAEVFPAYTPRFRDLTRLS